VVAFERMAAIVEVDTENFIAVVEPGVRLDQLDAALAPLGLVYPVFPGEYSSSLGGNVATNAGGMRAVKYGVTRHHVLGIEAVLPSGEVIRDGGKMVKRSTGYDLTQLVIGSEGTLALVTRAWLKLYPRAPHQATLLVPFTTLDEVTAAVPEVVRSGVGPLVLEYIDTLTMAAATAYVGLDLGIPDDVKEAALAYLVVGLESTHADRLEEDSHTVATQLGDLGALDVYVLPPGSAAGLIDAREKAFWVAKANGADDIIDVVVPRAAVPAFMARVTEIAAEAQAWIAGCGHAGDGNVHMAVFQKDPEARGRVMRALMEAGMALGGAISGEHGLGTEKSRYFLELEEPAKIALMRRIKAAFDPHDILNPGKIFSDEGGTPS
jgi:glycolate dehydrogenase FAD-linked subunit